MTVRKKTAKKTAARKQPSGVAAKKAKRATASKGAAETSTKKRRTVASKKVQSKKVRKTESKKTPSKNVPKNLSAGTKNARGKASNVRSLDSVRPSSALRTTGDDHRKILAIDVGGSSVKMLVNGEALYRKSPSGTDLSPTHLVELVNELAGDWDYEYISIGYPGLTGPNGPLAEPYNLGPGWVAFDFAAAFGKPVKVLNDAAMQAIGSYEGGRMLFLGVGTGLGSALIADGVIISLELSNLRWNSRQTVGDLTSKSALKLNGKRRWRKVVIDLADSLARSFLCDYVVIGGGNAKYLKDLPTGVRVGHNQAAFRGGFRVWELDFIPTMADSVTNKELRVIY